MEFLDKLRKKPKHVRQQIALWTSASISVLIFCMWWTTFTAEKSDSSQVSLNEALSPMNALVDVVNNAVEGTGTFSQDLKEKVAAMQYEASGSASTLAATAASSDVVYPEQIFGHEPPPQEETNTATVTRENPTIPEQQINP